MKHIPPRADGICKLEKNLSAAETSAGYETITQNPPAQLPLRRPARPLARRWNCGSTLSCARFRPLRGPSCAAALQLKLTRLVPAQGFPEIASTNHIDPAPPPLLALPVTHPRRRAARASGGQPPMSPTAALEPKPPSAPRSTRPSRGRCAPQILLTHPGSDAE